MTGRELIIYILQNNLEDEEIFVDGRLLGFLTIEEAAAKFEVGTATVRTWICLGQIEFVYFGGEIYIPNDKEPNLK